MKRRYNDRQYRRAWRWPFMFITSAPRKGCRYPLRWCGGRVEK